MLALGIQGLLLLGAGSIVVLGPLMRVEPVFSAVDASLALPQRVMEQAAAWAEFQEMTGGMAAMEAFAGAEMAALECPSFPSTGLSGGGKGCDPALAYGGMGGDLGLAGDWAGALAGAGGFRFLGVEAGGERVAVLFDVSASVALKAARAGYSMERIRDETIRLVDSFSPHRLFGLVQFSRRCDRFRDYAVPGTAGNREAARKWLGRSFVTNGSSPQSWRTGNPNGIELALQLALELHPDEVFLISDGSFQRDAAHRRGGETVPWPSLLEHWRRSAEGLPRTPRLHLIGVDPKDSDRQSMRAWASSTGGSYRDLGR